jgi:branched-chain amino acid transport system substrate-binding protein
VTGYPWYSINTPEHQAFLKAYQAKFKDYPRLGTIVGYNAIQSIAAGLRKTGDTDTEADCRLQGPGVATPFGPITYRAQDNQSTMGAYIGKTAYDGGKGVLVNYHYADGAKFQPSAEEVKKLRAAD